MTPVAPGNPNPGRPVKPVAPVDPVDPVNPNGPCSPTLPVPPVVPWGPVFPVEPTIPCGTFAISNRIVTDNKLIGLARWRGKVSDYIYIIYIYIYSDSEVTGSSPTRTAVDRESWLSSNNLEQVIYTRGAQANSAFHPSTVGKLLVPGNTRY